MKQLSLLILLSSMGVFASETDQLLKQYIDRFNLKPLYRLKDHNPRLTRLGKMLFEDVRLSRNNNISCQTCHHPNFGSGDALPVSIGEGGIGDGTGRIQHKGGATPRHANHVFNKGQPGFTHMFWDGRVSITAQNGLQTPEPALNSPNPSAPHLARLLKTPLEAQAMFPVTSETEMFGDNPEGYNNLQKWALLSKRIYSIPFYQREFQAIYGVSYRSFNFAYIAKALAHFQKVHFQATNTQWDKYLRGNLNALTENQKRGAIVFSTKGRCVACHNGPNLGGKGFQNSAAPQLTQRGAHDDLGLYEVTGKENHKHKFRVAPLRNLYYTAPYFHTGMMQTIEQVVEHYNNPWQSLKNFSVYRTISKYNRNFHQNFVEMTSTQINARLNTLPMFYRHHGPLGLTNIEKAQLVDFLKFGLKQYYR